MGFTYEKKTAAAGPFIEITGYEGEAPSLTVPDEIEGLPVRSIGNHALADRSDVREITLPRTLKTLHLFAFQNDANLEKIRVFDTADDCYDGVIRSCDALREIAVEMTGENNYVLMRELLQDTDNALSFLLHWPAGEGKQEKTLRLTFPEYVREAREDTMARAIHFTIEGAGMAYRECVEKHALLLTEYDRLLPRLTSYDDLSAAEICLDRLMYPEALGEAARAQYETWLLGHTEKVLLYRSARCSWRREAGVLPRSPLTWTSCERGGKPALLPLHQGPDCCRKGCGREESHAAERSSGTDRGEDPHEHQDAALCLHAVFRQRPGHAPV